MPAMMLGTGDEKSDNKETSPDILLKDAIKGLENLPAPTGKAGAAWKQEQARIVALIQQVQTWVNERVAQEDAANVA